MSFLDLNKKTSFIFFLFFYYYYFVHVLISFIFLSSNKLLRNSTSMSISFVTWLTVSFPTLLSHLLQFPNLIIFAFSRNKLICYLQINSNILSWSQLFVVLHSLCCHSCSFVVFGHKQIRHCRWLLPLPFCMCCKCNWCRNKLIMKFIYTKNVPHWF